MAKVAVAYEDRGTDRPTAPEVVGMRHHHARMSTYEGRVRATLIALGSPDPDGDMNATRKYLEGCEEAVIDPAVAAATIYTTVRHRHHGGTMLRAGASEEKSVFRWTEIWFERPAEAEAYAALIGKINSTIVADAENRIVTTNASGSDIKKTLAKMKPKGEVTLYDDVDNRSLAAETPGPGWYVETKKDGKVIDRGGPYRTESQANRYRNRISKVLHALPGWKRAVVVTLPMRSAAFSEEESSRAEDSAPCTRVTRSGVTDAAACEKLAKEIGPIDTDKDLYRLFAPRMREEVQEVFYVACVDVHGKLCGFTEIARGQVSEVHVFVEQVLQAVLAIQPCPTAFGVGHCHPSGKATPSEADKRLTEGIRQAAKTAIPNVVFMDHLIVGSGKNNREYYSFSDKRVKRG